MMGFSDDRKSFQIGLAVLIQYRRVTDTQQPTLPYSKDAAYYVARVKTVLTLFLQRLKRICLVITY